MKQSCPAPRAWIVAACEGMITVFERVEQQGNKGPLRPVMPVFPSLEEFSQAITVAKDKRAFDQLVLVGSASDIAWLHSSMPKHAAQNITAEIKYPLIPEWFRESPPQKHLTDALSMVLA